MKIPAVEEGAGKVPQVKVVAGALLPLPLLLLAVLHKGILLQKGALIEPKLLLPVCCVPPVF
jgi:hypothetical protein